MSLPKPLCVSTKQPQLANKIEKHLLLNKLVIAYTNHPAPYKYSKILTDLNIQYYANLHCFYKAMLEKKYSGIILDMKKVMETQPDERNKILSFAANLPTMRSITKSNKAIFLDNPDIFKCQCSKTCCLYSPKSCYTTVKIPVEISFEEDPAMAQKVRGIICNISENECNIRTCTNLRSHNFIYIKIGKLKNKLPIYAGICWNNIHNTQSCGYKLKFISIQEDQRSELINQL